MEKRISHFYECESKKEKNRKSEERMEEKMVEEVNYDLLPFWISHEAVADERKRDVGGGGGGEREGDIKEQLWSVFV